MGEKYINIGEMVLERNFKRHFPDKNMSDAFVRVWYHNGKPVFAECRDILFKDGDDYKASGYFIKLGGKSDTAWTIRKQ